MNQNTLTVECLEGWHRACKCDNACACECHTEAGDDLDDRTPYEIGAERCPPRE